MTSTEQRLDAIFRVLANDRRRQTLDLLGDGGTHSIETLADALSVRRQNDRKREYVALYQHHLPKMDDADIVDYDQATGSVDGGPLFHPTMAVIHAADFAFSRDILSLAAAIRNAAK